MGVGGLLLILQGSAGLFLPGLPCLEPWSTAPMCMLTRACGALRSVHDYKYGRIIYIFVHFFPRILVEVGVGLRRRREEAGPSLGVPPPVSLFTRVESTRSRVYCIEWCDSRVRHCKVATMYDIEAHL